MNRRLALAIAGASIIALTGCAARPALPAAEILPADMGTTACAVYAPGTDSSYLRMCSPLEVQVHHTLLVSSR